MIIFSPVRKIKAIMHIGKCLDGSFKKKAFAHCTNFSPVRKIKVVMHIGNCLFKKKAFAHNTNFSPVRKIKAVMYIGKCLDSSFKKKAFAQRLSLKSCLKLQLHDAIYRLRFYSNSLIHILSLSNSHNNLASIQKDRGDKSHRVIVALACIYMLCSVIYHEIIFPQ